MQQEQKKRKRHTPGQIIAKLREADVDLATGLSIGEVCRKLCVSEQTYYRWKNAYGGMKGDQMKRLKELERENGRLKKMVAEQALDIEMLKEVAKGEF